MSDKTPHPIVEKVIEKNPHLKKRFQTDPAAYTDFHDPYLFDQMSAFVKRFTEAIDNKEKVLIFSDFDTDGIPAAAMWHDLFSVLGHNNFEIYIPQRDVEGFGLRPKQVKKFADKDVDLLITTDCGIRSNEAIANAKDAGMDVIITDHHVAGDALPVADIIINPALENESYPFAKLCGAGVVFKILQALGQSDLDIPENFIKGQLDMAAIATISDMVELTDENRTMATLGMQLLRRTKRPGLRALYEKGRIQGQELTEVDIGFTVGSHINAASRLDQPQLAYELLVSRSYRDGQKLAGKLHSVYRKRKRRTKALQKSVRQTVSHEHDVVVAGSSDWKPALLGPVAHRIVDQTGKPTFLWGEAEGRLKGSARAAGHNVVKMLESVSDNHLVRFGGHEMAGGFELLSDSPQFRDDLHAGVNQFQVDETAGDIESVKIRVPEINWKLFQAISELGPFGVGHAQPTFLLENVNIAAVKHFGADGGHVRLTLTENESLEVVSFFAPADLKDIDAGDVVSLTVAIEKTTFGFKKKLQLKIKSIE